MVAVARFVRSALRARLGHALHSFRQLAFVQPGKAESRKWLGLPIEGVPPAGVPRHTVLYAAARPLVYVEGHAQRAQKGRSAGGQRELDGVSKRPPQTVGEDLAAVGVHAPHARDVPLQLAILDQCRHSRLSSVAWSSCMSSSERM